MAKKKKAVSKKPGGIRRFYRETAGELRKVSWPTRREAYNLTKIVVAVMIFMALLLGGLNFLFDAFFDLIL